MVGRALAPRRLALVAVLIVTLLVEAVLAPTTIAAPVRLPSMPVEPGEVASVGSPPIAARSIEPSASTPQAYNPRTPTEVVELRAETSRTLDNHDGSFTTEFYTWPIHYQPAGSDDWRPVEVGFQPTSRDGLVQASTAAPVAVGLRAADATSGFLQVEGDHGRIDFALAGRGTDLDLEATDVATVQPTVDEHVARYADVLPGVDLQVIAGARSAKTFLVLDSLAAGSAFTFTVEAPGLQLRAAGDGAAEFVDGQGTVVGRVPRPYAVDSSQHAERGGGAFSDAVSLSVGEVAGKPALTIAVDPAWLATATFPVYVDPTFTTGSDAYGDAFVSQAYPTQNFADYVRPDSPYYHELWLGQDPSNSNNVNMVLLKFDLSSIAGYTVDSASLSIFPYHQYYNSPTSTTTWVNKVTGGNWTESGVTWNNAPGSTNVTSGPTVEGETASFNVKTTVQGWVTTPSTNYGFKLHENGNGATYWKRLIASENGPCCDPELAVTYHRPTASTTTPNNFTKSRTVAWTYSDTAGHAQSHYQVQVSAESDFSPLVHDSGAVASSATSYAIPSGVTLNSGTQYWWRVRVKDGTSWSPYDSSMIVWDTGAPGGTVSINGGAATTNTSTVRLALSSTDSGTTSTYTNDGRSLSSMVAGCGSVTCGAWASPTLGTSRAHGAVTVRMPTTSWHSLTVDATANNRSTLAMDVMRDSTAAAYVGVVSDDNDGLRFELRSSGSSLTTLGYTATSTPGGVHQPQRQLPVQPRHLVPLRDHQHGNQRHGQPVVVRARQRHARDADEDGRRRVRAEAAAPPVRQGLRQRHPCPHLA